MAEIPVKFTLTGEDYEEYLRYFYTHTKTGRRHTRRLYALGVAAFLVFVWMEHDHPKFGIAHPAYFATYLTVSGAILGLGYWYAIRRLWPTLAQTVVRMSPQRAMFTETALTIDDHGLAVETRQGHGRLEWQAVEALAETDGAWYLFMGGINAFIIPKRGFRSPEELDEGLALLLQGIGAQPTHSDTGKDIA